MQAGKRIARDLCLLPHIMNKLSELKIKHCIKEQEKKVGARAGVTIPTKNLQKSEKVKKVKVTYKKTILTSKLQLKKVLADTKKTSTN